MSKSGSEQESIFKTRIILIDHYSQYHEHPPVKLLTYRRLVPSKYEPLDRRYRLKYEKAPSEEYMHQI